VAVDAGEAGGWVRREVAVRVGHRLWTLSGYIDFRSDDGRSQVPSKDIP